MFKEYHKRVVHILLRHGAGKGEIELMKETRIRRMEEYLREKQQCSLDALCDEFGISKITVRRDIDKLCESGVAEKFYGGVRYINQRTAAPTVPYVERDVCHIQEKEIIGKLAADLIQEGDTIFVDSGTTTLRLIKYVSDKKINLITNNLSAVHECLAYHNINLIVTGGEFYRLTSSFTGDSVRRALDDYNITKAFLASTGVSESHGFTNSTLLETGIKKAAIEKSLESYVMLDHYKWDIVSLATFAPLSGVTGIITDTRPPEAFESIFLKNNMQILCPA